MNEYQERLKAFVEECQHELTESGTPKCEGNEIVLRSIRSIERKHSLSGLSGRVSYWQNNELKKPINYESIRDLALIDPYKRTPEYIQAILDGQEETYSGIRYQHDEGGDLDELSKPQLKQLVHSLRSRLKEVVEPSASDRDRLGAVPSPILRGTF